MVGCRLTIMVFISVCGIQGNVNLDVPTVMEGFHLRSFSDMTQTAAVIRMSFRFLLNRIGTCVFYWLLCFPNTVSSFLLTGWTVTTLQEATLLWH